MNLVHKSVCLLLTSVMMFQVSAGFNTTPIQGAMYAEIHDPQRGCQKVYRGSANVIAHNIVQQMVVKVAHEHPQIDFFDTNGRWLLSEGLPNPATLTKPLAEMLQARLTVLPEVTRIEVIESNKQRGNQIVYLYNRFGDVIGHWHRF
ncbi:MAG TPA: hypothetical protein VLG71_01125, partial [Candidatus Limnocylindria bacterium]|nr:hypothetical protein [Candidatus Limnocylindria bacterium]